MQIKKWKKAHLKNGPETEQRVLKRTKKKKPKNYLKSFSLSLVTREMQIKRTLIFHHIPVKMTRIIHKMWKGKEHIHGQWGYKLNFENSPPLWRILKI